MDAKEELDTLLESLEVPENDQAAFLHLLTLEKIDKLLSTHDLVPVDSGPFRPDAKGVDFVEMTSRWPELPSWRKEEYKISKTADGCMSISNELTATPLAFMRYWPRHDHALLLLKELGIGGGK